MSRVFRRSAPSRGRVSFVFRLALIAAVCFIAPAAHAYIVSAEFIVNQLADRRGALELKDLTVQLVADTEGVDGPVEERIYLKRPERLRYVRELPSGESIVVEREGKRAEGDDTQLKRSTARSIEMLGVLLAPAGADDTARAQRILAALKAIGIDTTTVSLTLYGADARESAYLIGARAWEKDKPQIWLDQTTYLPVRLIHFVQENGKAVRYESRFTDYGSAAAGAFFPRVIENYRGETRIRRAEVTELKANQELPDTLFQLPPS